MIQKIAVVIPFYNADTTFPEAIASVRAQTRVPDQIIVVDDCSDADKNHTLIGLPTDIYVHRLARNSGPGAVRAAATKLATCDLIAYLDADDAWAPDKLERQEIFMAANSQLAACHTGTRVWRGGSEFGEAYLEKPMLLTLHNVLLRGHMLPSAFMIRKKALLAAGDWNEDRYVLEDWDLAIRVVKSTGAIGFIPEPLTHFRRAGHGNATSDPWYDLIVHLAVVHRHKQLISEIHGSHAVEAAYGRFIHRLGTKLGGITGLVLKYAGKRLMG